jgi:hypothetical protein
MEEGLCRGITAAEFKRHLQHKILVSRLLQDPMVMETLASRDYSSYLEAAKDDEKEGGVLLDCSDVIWDDEHELPKPLIPDRPMVPPRLLIHQQIWPELCEANPSGGVDLLGKGIDKLSVNNDKGFKPNEGKLNVEAWPLPAGWKKGDPLPSPPKAWTSNAASKQLFPAAKPTPPPADWEGMSAAIVQSNHKTNLLHYHFMNPAHKDTERFYNPLIEKYKCPMPECT